MRTPRPRVALGVTAAVAVGAAGWLAVPATQAAVGATPTSTPAQAPTTHTVVATGAAQLSGTKAGRKTATPIKHVVVLFDENVSYDHYFGTYPKAANTDGTDFTFTGPLDQAPSKCKGKGKATKHKVKAPKNDNLVSSGKLTGNPNLYQPFRLGADQAVTCDQNHNYGAEQQAVNNGLMDMFVQKVSKDTCTGMFGAPGLTMGYYDGNTTTALWNYAQNFAMSDNSYGDTFGPSTPGALELIAGQTHGFTEVDPTTLAQVATPGSYTLASPDAGGVGTIINDPDPAYDDCSDTNHTSKNTLAAGHGRNIGDLLNAKGVSWGWFQGGFKPTTPYAGTGYAVCGAAHTNVAGASSTDYSPHHNPFAYYASTANPHHLAPSSVQAIGHTDQANHQYDLSDFNAAVKAGNLPSVSFLKAAEYQDGHAAYSDPIDEQHFLVNEINTIQKSKFWKNTAIVIAYDDSDGWYDHALTPITNGSSDAKNDTAMCSSGGAPVLGGYQDRCGPGPRLPMLVISPYARAGKVDHHQLTQTSVLSFIEQNWATGQIGDSSFDATAGSMKHLFNFNKRRDISTLMKASGKLKKHQPGTAGTGKHGHKAA
jgi:phospholipase C